MALYVPFILYIKVYAPLLILPIQLQIKWWCPGYLVDYIKIGFEHCLFQYLVLPISPADVVFPKVASYLIVFIHFSLIFPHLGLYEKTVPTFGHTMYTCEKRKV